MTELKSITNCRICGKQGAYKVTPDELAAGHTADELGIILAGTSAGLIPVCPKHKNAAWVNLKKIKAAMKEGKTVNGDALMPCHHGM